MDRKNLVILLLAAVVLFLVLSPRASGYGTNSAGSGVMGANLGNTLYMASGAAGSAGEGNSAGGGPMALQGSYSIGTTDVDVQYAGTDSVSSASLIPREVVQTEDFGQFSPEKILTNQNYLDPRSQIGYPETIGGVLRNANRDFRSEPINPRDPVSIFNLSTIPPDTMRPKFEIGSAY
jgi:hypothetical protein